MQLTMVDLSRATPSVEDRFSKSSGIRREQTAISSLADKLDQLQRQLQAVALTVNPVQSDGQKGAPLSSTAGNLNATGRSRRSVGNSARPRPPTGGLLGSAYMRRGGAPISDMNTSICDASAASLTFSQKQRRAAQESMGVEDCPLPPVPSAHELLVIPHKLSLDPIAVAVVTRQAERFTTPAAQEAWKTWAFHTVTRELLLDAFWWFFADIFKAGARGSQALKTALFGRIAHHYMTVVYPTDGSRPNDRNLEAFGACLAEALSLCFHQAFPRSTPSFNASFHRRIEQQIMEWTRGVPRRDMLAHGTKHDAAHPSRPSRDRDPPHSEDDEDSRGAGAGGRVDKGTGAKDADKAAGGQGASEGVTSTQDGATGRDNPTSPRAASSLGAPPSSSELRWAVPVADPMLPHAAPHSARHADARGGHGARAGTSARSPAGAANAAGGKDAGTWATSGRMQEDTGARGAPAEAAYSSRRPASSSGTHADAGGGQGEPAPAVSAAVRWTQEYQQLAGRLVSGRVTHASSAGMDGGQSAPTGPADSKGGSGGGGGGSIPSQDGRVAATSSDQTPPLFSTRVSAGGKGGGGRPPTGHGSAGGASSHVNGAGSQGGWVITSLAQPLSGPSGLSRPLSSTGVRSTATAGGAHGPLANTSAKGSLTARCWTAGDATRQSSMAPSPAARPATSNPASRAASSGVTATTSRPGDGFQLTANSAFMEEVMSSYGLSPQRVKSGRLQRHMTVGARARDRSDGESDDDDDEEEESYGSFARGPLRRIKDAQAAYERQRATSAAGRREARRELAGTRVHMDTVRASVLQSDPRHFSNWIAGWTDKDEEGGDLGAGVAGSAGVGNGPGGAAGGRRAKGDVPALADVKAARRKVRRHEGEKPVRTVKRDKDSRDLLAKMTVRAMAAQSGNDADVHWHESLRAKMLQRA
eukprot:jgi/Mesvir1/19313/Mv10380-RA.1